MTHSRTSPETGEHKSQSSGHGTSTGQARVLVHRPGAVVVASAAGLFVRSARGERWLDLPDADTAWPRMQEALRDGVAVDHLPHRLASVLVDSGAVVEVSALQARSTERWQRYAMAWADDPTLATERICLTRFLITAGAVEAPVVRRTAAHWGLPIHIDTTSQSGFEIRLDAELPPTSRSACGVLHVHPGTVDGELMDLWLQPGPAHEGDAQLLQDAPAPSRALAAATGLLAALAGASGDPTWPWASLPIRIEPATQTLTDPEGRHTR